MLIYIVEEVASNSLMSISFSPDSPNLREVIIRVALSNDSPSSSAVLKALLGFSSLHRNGLQSHATRLKVSALSALAAAARTGVPSDEVIPHIAAGMLLCCFEVGFRLTIRISSTEVFMQIQQASETSSQWLCYISGVKRVLKLAGPKAVQQTSDMAALLYWVLYHDTLSRFSFLHWRHDVPAEAGLPIDFDDEFPQLISSEGLKVSPSVVIKIYYLP